MPRVVSSFESIRQTLDYGQFDVCETLLRDLLSNPEINNSEERDVLKEILAAVLARRALDHSRNFVARGNLNAARKILHKAWHQLENEGLEDWAEDARRGIAAAAGESDHPNFDANRLSEIIQEYLGPEHFGSLVADLPFDGEASPIAEVDRATRMVSSAKPKTVRNTDGVVVLNGTQASIGQLILKSFLRPRVVIAAILAFALVAGVGLTTRTTSYSVAFDLLRPTNTGDGQYDVKVPALPKQTLQKLPTNEEVIGPLSEELTSLAATDEEREAMTPSELKKAISSSIATSDFGVNSLTLQVGFSAPSEKLAEEGGKFLFERIVERHNEIVNSDLKFVVDQKRARIKAIEQELEKKREELREASKGKMIPAGDQSQQVDALLRMYTEASKGFFDASAKAASAEIRASNISDSRNELNPMEEWVTTSNDAGSSSALMPLYSNLAIDKQKVERLRATAEAGKFGPKHPTRLEIASLEKAIELQEQEISKREKDLEEKPRTSKMSRTSATYSEIDVQARMADAEKQGHAKAKIEWKNAIDKIEAEILEIAASDSNLPKIMREIDELSAKQSELRSQMWDLEAFAERNPGGLQTVSVRSTPEMRKSSSLQIILAAMGLAFLAMIIVSFTGGHRAVHVVVLGLLATLFHVR